jgi:hypothetical protein
MTHWSDGLSALGACPEAVVWCRGKPSLDAAWRTWRRGDWMWWLVMERAEAAVLDRRDLVRAVWPAVLRCQPANPHQDVTACLLLLSLWLDGVDVPVAELWVARAATWATWATWARTAATRAAARC